MTVSPVRYLETSCLGAVVVTFSTASVLGNVARDMFEKALSMTLDLPVWTVIKPDAVCSTGICARIDCIPGVGDPNSVCCCIWEVETTCWCISGDFTRDCGNDCDVRA